MVEDSLALESRRVALDLHGALSDIDPVRWHAGAADSARRKLRHVQRRLAGLTAQRWPDTGASLRARLCEVRLALSCPLPDSSARARWMAFRSAIVPAYESLQAALREHEIHVPSLRPTNRRRTVFHVTSGSLALVVLWALPAAEWAIVLAVPVAVAVWTLEGLRRTRPRLNAQLLRVLGPLAHPHEHHRVNSGTWYITAVALLSLTCAPLPCAVGLTAIIAGDPIAAHVGRSVGRVRLVHGRTLEGTLAFFVAVTIAALFVVLLFAPSLAWSTALAIAASGALAGALAELFSLRIDDNLSIPLAATAGAALTAAAFGVPLG